MLTRKQHELLVYIDRHLRETGFSPSFEEMKEALQLKSKSGIHRLISALEERGFLGRRHHRARALEVLRLPDNMTQPVLASTGALSGAAVGIVANGPAATVLPAGLAQTPGEQASGIQAAGMQADAEPTGAPPFSPNVIRGDFTSRLPGVRAASDAAAIQLPLYGRIAAGL
ncbi:MAG: hypothetical protein P4L71_12110, partial [Acetobacteraceae bacterium]|nr:hypothetical protein [Acetobacteraceae bacterium]